MRKLETTDVAVLMEDLVLWSTVVEKRTSKMTVNRMMALRTAGMVVMR